MYNYVNAIESKAK